MRQPEGGLDKGADKSRESRFITCESQLVKRTLPGDGHGMSHTSQDTSGGGLVTPAA